MISARPAPGGMVTAKYSPLAPQHSLLVTELLDIPVLHSSPRFDPQNRPAFCHAGAKPIWPQDAHPVVASFCLVVDGIVACVLTDMYRTAASETGIQPTRGGGFQVP